MAEDTENPQENLMDEKDAIDKTFSEQPRESAQKIGEAGRTAAAGVEVANSAVGGPVSYAVDHATAALSVASPVLRAATRFSRALTNAQPSYRFIVQVNGAPYGVFTECEPPSISWETMSIKEGGQNGFVHQLLGRGTEGSMTLKNGVGTSLFFSWFMLVLHGKFTLPAMKLRRSVTVTLLNPLKIPMLVWHIQDAFPVEWQGPQLKTSENSIAVQTIKLACGGDIDIYPGVGIG